MNIKLEELDQYKNYLNNISDIIVNEIIEKIISLTISSSESKKISSKIPQECFYFLENIINNYVSWNYIHYDKDELRTEEKTIINSNSESQIFPCNNISQISNNDDLSDYQNFNNNTISNFYEKEISPNSLYGINNWDIFDEPKSNNFDRYATTLIKYKPLINENKYYDKSKVVKEEDDDEDEDEENQIKNSKISIYSKVGSRRASLKYISNSKFLKTTSSIKSLLNNNDKIQNKPNKPKTLNEIMNEFSFHSINDGNETKRLKYLDKLINDEELRKEKEMEKENNIKEKDKNNKKK